MANLIKYIAGLSNQSFAAIEDHFSRRNVEVKDEGGSRYMLIAGKNVSYTHEPVDFQLAVTEAVGTILVKETNALACFGFPNTIDLTPQLLISPGPYAVTEYVDGTLIRAYCLDSKDWYLSTNCVINAYNSYWGSAKSFGDLFDQCLFGVDSGVHFANSSFAAKLNPKCSYQFILKADSSVLCHIGTFDHILLQYVDVEGAIDGGVQAVKASGTVYETVADIQAAVENDNYNGQGVIFYPQAGAPTQAPRYKLLSQKFSKQRALLGNTPDLHLRSLQCLAEGTDSQLLQEFAHVPKITRAMAVVQEKLAVIIKEVHALYIEKYVKRNRLITIDYYYKPIMRALHGHYRHTRQKITRELVKNTINSYHPRRQLFILNGLDLLPMAWKKNAGNVTNLKKN